MNKVENKEKYIQQFSEYKHNIAVIYSSLEGQYDGELFVDSKSKPQIFVLFTPFSFHFVAGNAELENVVDEMIRYYLKSIYLKQEKKKQLYFLLIQNGIKY